MTDGHSSPVPPQLPPRKGALTVVIDPGRPPGDAPVLELSGPLETARLEAALARLAAAHTGAPAWHHRVHRHGPGRHTLRLTTHGATAREAFPAGRLADLLTHKVPDTPTARSFPAPPLQRELIADADAHPGTDHQVEQLTWAWYGPLDLERFTSAWQSVVDRESVLRAAIDDGPEPRIVLHDRVTADVVQVPHGAVAWHTLVGRDRRRGIDIRRPGPLRITVLGGGPAGRDGGAPARVLLTYHHALLDGWSARLLVREFYRAYLAGGRLPGGERRPDLGDYTRWLAGRDTAPARELWSRILHPGPAATWPARPEAGGGTGTGRTRLRLTADQTEGLTTWAAHWGSTESGALQAAWALLLYRSGGARDVAPVRFSTTVSGRGIPFDGVEYMPGALRSPLPLSLVVDPRSSVPELLAQVRDRALDMAAYEWVSAGQIRSWTGDAGDPGDTLLVVENPPRGTDGLAAACAAQGFAVDPPESLGVRTAFPLTVVAHHDSDGGLVLTACHDRARLADATEVLTHSALLLGELPRRADPYTPLAEILELLPAAPPAVGMPPSGRFPPAGAPPPPPHITAQEETPAGPGTPDPARDGTFAPPALVTLRHAAHPDAGAVCLVQSPGIPRSLYDRLARAYRGPEEIVLLPSPPGGAAHAGFRALRPLAEAGRLLVLGGFSGCGAVAYEIARLVALEGVRPPLVVLTDATAGTALARTLRTVAERIG